MAAEEWARIKELFRRYGSWTVARRALVFFGPAFVISVGYMDPGNWGTDIEGGARFGYQLLWVIFLGEHDGHPVTDALGEAWHCDRKVAARGVPRSLSPLGFGRALDHRGACGHHDRPRRVSGRRGRLEPPVPYSAVSPALLTGVIISLILYLERYGLRKIELVVLAMIAVIGFGYMIEIFLAKPPPARSYTGSWCLLCPQDPPWWQSASSARPLCRTTCTCTAL